MTREQEVDAHIDKMVTKFKEMKGKNLTDEEITRVFDGCVFRNKLIEKFTIMREAGMKMKHVRAYTPGTGQLNRFNQYSHDFIGKHTYIGARFAEKKIEAGEAQEQLKLF